MTSFLRLAFRNLSRNRRRTSITVLVAAGGVTALVLAGGFFAHMYRSLREATIRNGMGHLQIYAADRFARDESRVLETGLDGHVSVAEAVARLPHVRGVAPRIEFTGMLANGSKSATFMATATSPSAEARLGFVPTVISGRRLAEPGDATPHEALLGVGLARSLGATLGETVTLLAVTSEGALNGIDVEIVGLVRTGFTELDNRVVRMSVPAAQQLLDSQRVSALVVWLDDTAHTGAVAAAVPGAMPAGRSVAVRTWSDLAVYYHQVRAMFGGIFLFLGVLVAFMVVMSSGNTLTMAILERTREVGTMLALGTPRSWVLGLLLAEGFVTGVIGALVGLAAATATGALLNTLSLPLPPPPGNSTGWVLQVVHEPSLWLSASLLTVVTLTVAAILPAWRASRLRVVDALAHV